MSGEVRSVSNVEARVTEALKLGFKRIMLPKSGLDSVRGVNGKCLLGVDNLSEAIRYISANGAKEGGN